MENCGLLKNLEVLHFFKVAKLSSQKFPKIDELFLKSFDGEISKTWTILTNKGVHHELIYNQQQVHPLIISGWPILEAYYNLPNDVVVTFGYYGNNKFAINSFKEVINFQDLPYFHSRYVYKREIYAFDHGLTNMSVDLPRIKLHEEFAEVLRWYEYEDLLLCGDNGKVKMKKLFHVGDIRRTKLGYGWDEFCKDNNFKAGDKL